MKECRIPEVESILAINVIIKRAGKVYRITLNLCMRVSGILVNNVLL